MNFWNVLFARKNGHSGEYYDDLFAGTTGGGGASLLTVIGTAPLTLANAVARAMRSLTQFGKTEQDGTPTPSTPQDIICNNGALKLVDDARKGLMPTLISCYGLKRNANSAMIQDVVTLDDLFKE